MKRHLHKRNECSVGLLIHCFRRNELTSVLVWYIFILIALSTLPLTSPVPAQRTSLSLTSAVLLSFSSFFGKATLPLLAGLCPTSANNDQFTPKAPIRTAGEKQLNDLADFRPTNNNHNNASQPNRRVESNSIVYLNDLRNSEDSAYFENLENDESDHRIVITKESVFPCLDSLEVSLFNLSEPVSDYHHLIRVYHSNALNKQTNSSAPFSAFQQSALRVDRPLAGRPTTKQGREEDQFTYVKELILSDPAPFIHAKYSIHCGLFDPVYLLYCFRYVSINQTNGQIRFESEDLYCLPTLLETVLQAKRHRTAQDRRPEKRNKSQKNAELTKNSDHYADGYGPSLRLYERENEWRRFDLNKANQHTQTKHVVCSCGKKSALDVRQTNHRIRLSSGNGYCGGGGKPARPAAGEVEATAKSLIKIRKLNFEFCFIDLTLPTWIEIRVKDVLLIDKKDQDLRQLAANSLIIRDGQTYISPQLNYLHSLPTFHYVSSGLLRFESSSLGNQYTIELNQLSDKLDLSAGKSRPTGDLEEEDAYARPEKAKSETYKRDRFMNERQTKLNHTERSLRNRSDQDGFKAKLNQALNLKHLSPRHHDKSRTDRRTDLKDESLFVLLIDPDGQQLLIDNQIGLNKKINRFLSENNHLNSSTYERLLYDELNAAVERQERVRSLVLNLIVLLLCLLLSVSVSVFVFILARTQIRVPTGNQIRFGLPDEHFLQHNYQEVRLSNDASNRSSLRSKLVKIDEERIYESCRTRNSTSDQEESDSQNDLLNDTEDGSETENELNNLSKGTRSSEEFSNTETLKNETALYKSSFKDDFHELNKKRKMFKNCFNGCGSKDDVANEAVGSRLSQCSFPTSEISLELDYYDYLTPFVPKAPFVTGDGNSNNL